MTFDLVLDRLSSTRVLVSLPATQEPRRALVAAEVLIQEGLDVLLADAAHPELLDELSAAFGMRALLGVHSITASTQIKKVSSHAAALGTAETAQATVVKAARAHEFPLFAGGFTPTELVAAAKLHPAGVMVHPADVLGTSYATHAIAAVPQLPVLVSGASAYAAGQWFAAGALAVIPDRTLVNDALVGGDLGQLRERARNLASEVRSAAPWQGRS